MIHTVVGATVACGALGFIVWALIYAALRIQFYAGVTAFHEGLPYDVRWSAPKRYGWDRAWGEQRRARLGYRTPRG